MYFVVKVNIINFIEKNSRTWSGNRRYYGLKTVRVLRQQALITEGELDSGFMTLCQGQRTRDNYITLFEEEIVLAIPRGHPLGCNAAPPGEPLAVMDLAQLKYEPFVLMYKESTIRSMIRARLCCGVIPWHYVKNHPDGVACFALPSHPMWEVAASYGKYSYLSNAAREFIRLAREFWMN